MDVFFQTILQATPVNPAKKHMRLLFKFFYTSIMITTKNITSTVFLRNAANEGANANDFKFNNSLRTRTQGKE